MSPEVATAVADAIGGRISSAFPIPGGSIATTVRATLDDGRVVVVKHDDRSTPGMFSGEAHGLNWLRVDGGPRVPRVLAERDTPPGFLVMEWIEPGPTTRATDVAMGRALATMHRAGAPSFGLDRPNQLATIDQDNTPAATWAEFLRERRILPLTRRAVDQGGLSATLASALERLAEGLEDLVGPQEPPARLHGDLWAGNAMTDVDGRPVVIDPAVYGGHREIDLAMMRLFGGFSTSVFEAYDETYPLAPGHEERVALNQILPLLVHVILFGAGYVSRLRSAVARYVPVR